MRYEGRPREGFPQGDRQAPIPGLDAGSLRLGRVTGQELVATAVREIDGTNKRDRYQNDKGGQKNENDHWRLLRT
jgi:hypothetical protein